MYFIDIYTTYVYIYNLKPYKDPKTIYIYTYHIRIYI